MPRLNKFIAENLGISRRAADLAIAEGQVYVNNHPAMLGAQVNGQDKILFKGKPVAAVPRLYYLFYKPVGYLSSRRAQGSAPTLYTLLPPTLQALKTVGRLDRDSEGLLLLSNDGDFAFRLTHPKFAKQKIYELKLDRPLTPQHQQLISSFGVTLKDGPSKLSLMSLDAQRLAWQVKMHEGRNRQIRRTFGALGYHVNKLKRLSFGPFTLGKLKPGEYQKITPKSF